LLTFNVPLRTGKCTLKDTCAPGWEPLDLAVGPRARLPEPKWPKTYPTYDITHKKMKPKKLFFQCKLEDSPSLVRVWITL